MKKIKNVVLILFIGLLSIIYLNDEMIGTFAKTYNNEVITEGKIYKSGDVINLADFVDITSDPEYYYIKYWSYYISFYEYYEGYSNRKEYSSLEQYFAYYDENSNREFSVTIADYESGNYDDPQNHYGIYNMTLPQVEGEDVYWKVQYTYDDYSYYVKNIRFVLYDYDEPEAKIECDKEAIEVNQSTECTLSVDYKSKLSNFKFKLNASNFKVSDESGLNNWTITSSDNNIYNMTNDPTNITDNTLKQQKFFKFRLTAKDTEESVNISDNVKLTNIAYTDEVNTDEGLDNLKTTLKINVVKKEETKTEEPKKEEVKEEAKEEVKKEEPKVEETKKEEANPQTADNVIPYIIFFIMSVTAITVLVKKRKRI